MINIDLNSQTERAQPVNELQNNDLCVPSAV